jgi:hypothetical protein
MVHPPGATGKQLGESKGFTEKTQAHLSQRPSTVLGVCLLEGPYGLRPAKLFLGIGKGDTLTRRVPTLGGQFQSLCPWEAHHNASVCHGFQEDAGKRRA